VVSGGGKEREEGGGNLSCGRHGRKLFPGGFCLSGLDRGKR
jgi:hypothetical protein